MFDLTIRGELAPRRLTARSWLGRTEEEWASLTRGELGLPQQGTLIGTGHQAELWHPGILAKYVLADAVAELHGAQSMHIVADQDAGGFAAIAVPVRDDSGELRRDVMTLALMRRGVPTGRQPAFAPDRAPRVGAPALAGVQDGLERARMALEAAQREPTAARQVVRAIDQLLADTEVGLPRLPEAAYATDLMRTTLGRALLERMAEDPLRCARAYNRAIRAVPGATIEPLVIRRDWIELPLWRIDASGRRRPAFDADVEAALEDPSSRDLLPRALMLTGIIRLAVCDLFVHGIGGGRYDRVMKLWMTSWLRATVAPAVVASADVRLPLSDSPAAGAEVVVAADAALAASRRAWHDPEPEEGGPGPVKRELLAAIAGAPRGSRRRREAFRSMHRELGTLRGVHVGRVERLQREARSLRRAARDASVAMRRDWSFVLHEPAVLRDMAAAIRQRVAETGRG